MQVLEFDSIELSYNLHKVLSSVYMRCNVGEVVGLLGRNGSGKSSLMKVVFGSEPVTHKSVRYNGEGLTTNYVGKRLIAYLPQEGLIPSFLTIKEALNLFKIPEKEIIPHIPDVEDFFKLTPKELSGGYLRMIETLLILKSKATFCILDEPFSGLMPLHVEMLKEIILQQKQSKGIILTDHLYRHVTSVVDRIYLLANGKTYEVKNEEQLISLGYVNG